MKESILTQNERQMINLGISITGGCRPCTKYHVRKCMESGLTDDFISYVIEKAEQVSTQAVKVLTAKAFKTLNRKITTEFIVPGEKDNETDILIGLAISYTLNSTVLLGEYLNYAKDMGISREKISEIMAISKFIFQKAKSHADILCEKFHVEKNNIQNGCCSPGCGC